VLIRAMHPTDADALVAFHAGLSKESIYRRFFSPHPKLTDAEVQRFTHVDGTDRLAIVAFDGPRLAGVARADRFDATDRAEVAVVVADELQHEGVGTALLERLVDDAIAVGIHVFEADTLFENQAMLNVFRHLGFRVSSHYEFGVVHVTFPITPTADYAAARAHRPSTLTFDEE
jgi:RimJ/RimL family protein N-acetyltransferase